MAEWYRPGKLSSGVELSAVIFRAKNTENEGATVLRNVGDYNSDTVLKSRRFNVLPDVTKSTAH
jgi:hypothetical protein